MKKLVPVFLLLASPLSAQLTISQAELDSLELNFTLDELTVHLDKTFRDIDRPLLIQRKWKTYQAFYGYWAAKKELKLLSEIRDNLKAIHALNAMKKEQADIRDMEFLQSRNDLITKEISVLRNTEECRSNLFLILQLCHVEIISRGIQETSKDTDPSRD